jgi:hypothetical protein
MFTQPEIAQCIERLRLIGVSEDIIEQCFIPEETETIEEIMGSVYMAVDDAKLDLSIAENIIAEIFKEYFKVDEVPDSNAISIFTEEIEPDIFTELKT